MEYLIRSLGRLSKRYRRWTHFAAPSHRPEPRGRQGCLAAPPRARHSQATQPSSSQSTGESAIIAMLLFGELRQVSVDVSSLVARE